MRILHVSTRLILGGSQENTVLSCEGQSRRGHEVHLAFGPIYGPEGSLLDRVEKFRTSDGRRITTHVVPDLVREVSPSRDIRAGKQLRQLIRELKPDIVHTHSSKAGILGRIAASQERASGRVPSMGIVHTIHGPPFMPIEGGSLRRLKIGLMNYAYTIAERLAARRCDRLISVADAMTAEFLSRGIGRAEQYITVRSGMETDLYLNPRPGQTREEVRDALGLTNNDFVIGTVARLAEHKGHDDLLDALSAHLASTPNSNWRLLWIGDGWWRERLQARIESTNLRGKVIITGLVDPDQVPGYMRAMDVLAHPSSREGLPRTAPQAFLCATPVVAYDADGTREVVLDPAKVGADRATGKLVPIGDKAALREALEWMATHETERKAMAHRAREMCREAFSAEKMVEELDRVYANTIGGVHAKSV